MQLARIRQIFKPQPVVSDVRTRTKDSLNAAFPNTSEFKGKRILVTAGSRGIADILPITQALVEWLCEVGADPSIIPAMGSHGGATAEGQNAQLGEFGITPDSMRVPFLADMTTERIGEADGVPLIWAKAALEADGVFAINRIKPHTGFVSLEAESGLCKILTIGVGKQAGAEIYHRLTQQVPMDRIVCTVAREMIERGRVWGGLGIVETSDHKVSLIEACTPQTLLATEKALLAIAKSMMPQFPFSDIDTLYVQKMGKEISGAGADPNVIARKPDGFRIRNLPRDGTATIGTLLISSLTPKSKGNAVGIGFADGITQRLFDAVDPVKTMMNAQTAYCPEVGVHNCPVYADDRAMLETVLSRNGNQRVVVIESTLNLGTMYVSGDLLEAVRGRSEIEVLHELQDVVFDGTGHLQLAF